MLRAEEFNFVIAKKYRVSFGGNENVLKLTVVMVAYMNHQQFIKFIFIKYEFQ